MAYHKMILSTPKNLMKEAYLTVTQLNTSAKELVESCFPNVLVEGEISNFSKPSSGHWYFSLKDENCQIRCAMFIQDNLKSRYKPKNGDCIQVKGKISIYTSRGDFQLIITSIKPSGDGLLQRKYEALVKKLAETGIFSETNKKPLPYLPKKIGIITSPTGAAIKDILSVLKRRLNTIPIIIYPAQVQGIQSSNEIIKALNIAIKHNVCDVLILARGGGSLEDLWGFNDETLAKKIFDSPIPIISGIGHEIDFTIADLVADKRAPTPSAAAELVSPNKTEIINKVLELENKIIININRKIYSLKEKLGFINKRLRHPGEKLEFNKLKLNNLKSALISNIKNILNTKYANFHILAKRLDTVSPLATLERGYSIVTKQINNKIVTNSSEIKKDEKICIKLKEGYLNCVVEESL